MFYLTPTYNIVMPKTLNNNYNTKALELAKAIDIAIDAFNSQPPQDSSKSEVEHIMDTYLKWKYETLNPLPDYRNMSSLRHRIQDVMTYFQEATGDTVEYFWKQISEQGLIYKREDRLAKILTCGHIQGRIEYEYVVDIITVAAQEGRISAEEAVTLSSMIEVFERRN